MLALRWLLIALKLAQTSAANPCAGAYQLALGCGFDLLPDARRRTECNELLIVGHGSPIFVLILVSSSAWQLIVYYKQTRFANTSEPRSEIYSRQIVGGDTLNVRAIADSGSPASRRRTASAR
jgi:hypothetical protein